MTLFAPLVNVSWAVTTGLEVILLASLVQRRAYQSYPYFTAYVVATVLQSVGVAVLYRIDGLRAATVWVIAWSTQSVVTLMRFLVLVELAGKILTAYAGIRMLARGLMAGVGLAVLGYVLLFSEGKWDWMLMNAVRGLELAMAASIVTMLLFARYYRLPLRPLPGALGVGLCLYSSFYVIDYSLLEKVVQRHTDFWNFLGILTFLASLMVWLRATMRYRSEEEVTQPALISQELYGKLSPEVNLRLYLLNRQVSQMMRSGEPRA
jgi:hypothetical protein